MPLIPTSDPDPSSGASFPSSTFTSRSTTFSYAARTTAVLPVGSVLFEALAALVLFAAVVFGPARPSSRRG